MMSSLMAAAERLTALTGASPRYGPAGGSWATPVRIWL